MRFRLMSVFVEDQDKALEFYTDVLNQAQNGGHDRWTR
jgi:catechol 2,3-dioxygenase-like lactoylglutathione lyase family enzyme